MTAQQQIAKLLRTPEEVILRLVQKMEKITGKKGVLEKIFQENQERVEQRLKELGVKKRNAEEVYEALLKRAEKSSKALFDLFQKPDFNTINGCKTVLNVSLELAGRKEGFFLSLQKAKELLRANPPKNIIKILGYKNIDELLEKEDVLEVFCALRFAEDSHWLNDVFFREYRHIKKSDFEKRKINLMVLPEKWTDVGAKFTGKKLHNISHLKELGVIFLIPWKEKFSGQTIEIFTLVLHYLHEIDFYSRLFEYYSKNYDDFAAKIISSLKGEVSGLPLPDEKEVAWRIIQRYLAKDDINDPRLFEAHVSPEAIHWAKAERDIFKLAQRFPHLDLNFWDGLDRVGDYFPLANKNHEEVLISFDLIDNVISLSKKSTVLSKYLYHQQEALWNKIFIDYIGKEKTEKLIMENLHKGFIVLKSET